MSKSEDTVIISIEEYNKYQEIEMKLEKERENVKTWKDKYMQQVAENKTIKEEKGNEEIKKKYEELLKEAQMVYDESQKLERGIIKLIKSLA